MLVLSDKVILTIKDQVYQIIRQNILSGQLQPGDRINEVQIAKELNVSRSPIRSAINELIGEGLLESIPNKSVRVKQLTEKQIIDVFEFRLFVESYVIEKVIACLDDQIINKLVEFKENFRKKGNAGRLNEYVELDTQFHGFLVECSGNEIVQDSMQRISVLTIPFRVISLTSNSRFQSSIIEHIGIIDAILDHDVSLAETRCREHLLLAKNEIIIYLQKVRSSKTENQDE
jgi:DNA-binding GntR family transcriptional regulator